jgi:ABC-2 type transport system permease protein
VRGMLIIFRREMAGLFLTPLGWILFLLALIVNGFYFTFYIQGTGGNVGDSLSLALGGGYLFWVIMVLLPPLLTMRMISEEGRSGMLEFLLTAPIRDVSVIAGKALAATCFLSLLWSSNLIYAAICEGLGATADWGHMGASLLGMILLSALFSSIGLVASTLTNTPLLAAFLGFFFNILMLSLGFLEGALRGLEPAVRESVMRKVDIIGHFQSSFVRGALDSADIVFFLGWTGVFLFLATRLLEARRWW